MKVAAYCGLIVSTILVLAWPLVLMFSAFIFDAPIRSWFDATKRYALVIYVLSYPVGYLGGIAYLIARRTGPLKGQAWWTKWALFLFLLPIVQLGLLLLIVALA
jgi:hypothetical protein